jgi:PTS system mannose-specific IIB component/fructoselysine and glucoselysine-specific PTS system IIB component
VSWVLARVDDRLVHGQVLVAWGARLSPARIWVVDDAVAASAWEAELFRSSAPGVDVRVCGVAQAAAAFAEEAAAPGAAFLIVRDLATARRLAEAQAMPSVWNLGGLHYAPGKDKVCDYLYLDAADRADARWLLQAGASLEVQDVPASRAVPLVSLDPAVTA